jgi:pseudaminic acid cytidylyltransferase
MNVAIIPARGGSKRIPKKNIQKMKGLPIIAWTIRSVIKSGIFDRVIVSTDSNQIANISKKYKAETPFTRPKNLSSDYTVTSAVIKHAIKWLEANNCNPENICCIYPTSASISSKDLKKGLKKLKSNKFNYVFSVQKNNNNIFRSFKKDNKGNLKMIFPQNYKKRTQDLGSVYNDAGQFYWAKTKTWLKQKKIFEGRSSIIEIPRSRSIDIDTLEDWKLAEKIYTLKL